MTIAMKIDEMNSFYLSFVSDALTFNLDEDGLKIHRYDNSKLDRKIEIMKMFSEEERP